MRARLVLARAAQIVLRNGLDAARHHGAGADVSDWQRQRWRSSRAIATLLAIVPDPPIYMTVLVVGSVALDSVETPFGKADNVLGGSGTFFSASASHLAPVQLVGVVGNDYPIDELEARSPRAADRPRGARARRGRVVPLARPLPPRSELAETLETHLGVFSNFRPKIPEQFRNAPFVFLGNIDPRLQLDVLHAGRASRSSSRATR